MGQFKTLLESAVESVEDRNRIRENNEGVIVNTNEEYNDSEFPGLIIKIKYVTFSRKIKQYCQQRRSIENTGNKFNSIH